ncbi:MAG: NADH-quinone oxidoreductase subunit NuoG [Anaerolineae bacterium]
MANINLTIDDRPVSVPAGTLVTDAAKTIGADIPVFCSHSRLDPLGACRMCLCEIGDSRGQRLQTACTVPVAEGMIVKTDTKLVKETQEATLAFILTNHPLDCPICDKGGECPLQDQTFEYGPGLSQFVEPKRRKQKHYPISDLIMLDQERCILCWRCTRYLEEWEDKPQLGLLERGGETIIDIFPGRPVDAKTSGNIIDLCPVGALTNRVSRFRYRPWAIEGVETICTHCAVGCNVRADVRHNELRRVTARENAAVNDLWLCDKGRFAVDYVNSPQRLTTPLVRRSKGGALEPSTWDAALTLVADRLSGIAQTSGPAAVGAIGSAKLANETSYLLQKLMRTLVGSNNVDHRFGAAVAAVSNGLPALRQVDSADLIVLLGFDPSEEAPVLELFIKRAARRKGARLLIAHPRRVELTKYPGTYLPYRPGGEVALFHGMARAILKNKWENEPAARRIPNYAQLAGWVSEVTPAVVKALAGVEQQALEAAAQALAQAKNPLILFGPLLTRGPAGVATLQALQNLVWLCGHGERLAYVGLEANSQGARDMGLLPAQLPGQASLDDAAAREHLGRLWNTPLPAQPGLSYGQMIAGGVKALYVMGADPAADSAAARAALAKLDFLVVQDIFLSETANLADVVLPAAASFIEADGTFTNLEGRVQRGLAGNRPHGQAAADWAILLHLARLWPLDKKAGTAPAAAEKREEKKGKDKAARTARRRSGFDFDSLAAIMQEISRAIPAYAGIHWDALAATGKQTSARPAANRKFQAVDLKTSGGDGAYPLALVGGTLLFDGGRLLRATEKIAQLTPAPFVGLNAADAQALGLSAGDNVTVSSAAGQVTLQVKVDASVQPGSAWVPSGQTGEPANLLTGQAVAARVAVSKA